MWLALWDNKIEIFKIWNDDISAAYLGDEKVWPIITTPIFKRVDWVIVATEYAKPDTEYVLDWVTYFVASNKRIVRNKIDSWFPANRIVTTKLTDMGWMMYWARNFNQDISTWDTSNVRRFDYLFAHCDSFNRPIDNFDFSSVRGINWMFFFCSSFNKKILPKVIPENRDIGWYNLLSWCSSYNQPLWPFFKKINTCDNMFALCRNFDQDCSMIWQDVWWVKSLSGVYYYADNFNNNIPKTLNNNYWYWIAIDMMFAYARRFNQDILPILKQCKIRYIYGAFEAASSFNQPLNDLDVSAVKDLRCVFMWASSFNQPLDKRDVRSAESMNSIFKEAYNFSQNISNWQLDSLGNNNEDYEFNNWYWLVPPAWWAFRSSRMYDYQKPNLKWYSEYDNYTLTKSYSKVVNEILEDFNVQDIKTSYYDRDLS